MALPGHSDAPFKSTSSKLYTSCVSAIVLITAPVQRVEWLGLWVGSAPAAAARMAHPLSLCTWLMACGACRAACKPASQAPHLHRAGRSLCGTLNPEPRVTQNALNPDYLHDGQRPGGGDGRRGGAAAVQQLAPARRRKVAHKAAAMLRRLWPYAAQRRQRGQRLVRRLQSVEFTWQGNE